MQPHTIDTRWVKIHSVRKILVFSIFHITSLFLCVTLRLRASALKSTAVFRFSEKHAMSLISLQISYPYRVIPKYKFDIAGFYQM